MYVCDIKGGNITDPNETYEINTKANTKANAEVICLQYSAENGNTVDFIPNSIFNTFVNLEVLLIRENQNFKIMKPQYLKDAKKLKLLLIFGNKITNLDENLFVEADNLEYISFEENKIESIHKRTFNGLQKLQVLRLQGNLIKNVHFETFSHLINLQILDLLQNECINHKFTNLGMKFTEIETKIGNNCTYNFNSMQLSKTVKWLKTKITNMTKENIRDKDINNNAIKGNKESLEELQRNIKDDRENSIHLIMVLLIVLVCLFLIAIVTMVFVIKNIQWRKNQINVQADMELY